MNLLIISSVLMFLPTQDTYAETILTDDQSYCSSHTYRDDNNDGLFEKLVLECAFATTHDTITIYPRNNTFDTSIPWQKNIAMQDAIWIFDTAARGRASLIIDFHPDGSAIAADLYDDKNGDAQVAYHIRDKQVIIDESAHWSVRVRAKDGWWISDTGVPNTNLEILVDGPIYAAFNSEPTLSFLKNDGVVDFHIQVTDENNDGRPDWEWIDVWPKAPKDWAVVRTLVMVNTQRDEPPFANAILWPYLGTAFSIFDFVNGPERTGPAHPLVGPAHQLYGIVQGYNQRFAPIQIHWQTARIAFIGEFVASRGSEHNWFMYSVKRIQPGQVFDANFEAPFGFFDLAGDKDGLPELQVRLETTLPEDVPGGFLRTPMAAIRYSWDQDNNGEWDYKVDAQVELKTQPIQVGDLRIRMIPYEKLPSLIKQKSGFVTFVAREGRPYKLLGPLVGERDFMMEGIYTWSTVAARKYLAGLDIEAPINLYNDVPIGDRAEYRIGSSSEPALYMSAIDHSLHLLFAEKGEWNIPQLGGGELYYSNLDKDGYIDQWAYKTTDANGKSLTERQLNASQDYLLYSDQSQIYLQHTTVKPSLFQTMPPTNSEEWKALGVKLGATKIDFKPGDFRSMMQQFDGPEIQITRASIHDYRTIGDGGFRFVLDLQPNFEVNGPDLLPVHGLRPGSYVVSYDGAFRVEPITPPSLSASLQSVTLPQLEQDSIQIQLRNDGLQDLPSATLELWATPPQGKATMIATQTVSLLAQVPISSTLQWAPPTAGTWMLTPQVRQQNGQVVTFDPVMAIILPNQVGATQLLSLSGISLRTLPLISVGLVGFTLIAMLIFWQQSKTSSKE